jgi:histidinol dehydrogenase
MKTYKNPNELEWEKLTQRPTIDRELLTETVSNIFTNVRRDGDKALFNFAKKFDGVELSALAVTKQEIALAVLSVPAKLKAAIQIAYTNIYAFHEAQREEERITETTSGVKCWRKSVAIEKVGLYIPGGSAPLFSTILMLGIPAKIAGCKEVVMCTPPDAKGAVNAAILYTASLVGITSIFKVGGAQAIAAMSYGTETIPSVHKIFGPGNQYVTKAKEIAQQNGVAIDMPAGPSEVLVIADDSCNPRFVAADLLSQAEHGADSQVVLLSDSESVIESCLAEVEKQVELLPRIDAAMKALENSKAIVLDDLDACISFSNLYAPEHLIIASETARNYLDGIVNAGSVFIGNYSCESAGDYASGTNHTLPTNGFAKSFSGVSLDSFVKKITFQELNKEGIKGIGEAIEIMAEAEGLMAHKNAVTLRLKELNND